MKGTSRRREHEHRRTLADFQEDVKSGGFPGAEHGFTMQGFECFNLLLHLWKM